MPDTLTDKHHDWVRDALGVDPRGHAAGAVTPSGGFIDDVKYQVGNVENAAGDAWSAVKIKAEEVQQSAAATVDKVAEKVEDVVDDAKQALGAGPPPTPKPTGPVTLKSETEAKSPSNRTRTKLGVGERVTLTVTPGPGNWHASGAKLSAKTGSKVTMTAPPRPGSVEVTVDVGGTTQTMKFSVVAPSSMSLVFVKSEHYNVGVPNAGFYAQIYLGPDDVNFGDVTFTEDEIGAKTSGSWSGFNGEGHHPNPSPLGCTSTVVSGKGTKTLAQDHCFTGYFPDLKLTDWTGEETWVIPWHWQCGSGSGLIGRATQRVVTTADGTTTISKAGASFSAPLS